MADRHIIYAYLSTDVKVRISPAMGWDNAIRVFYECGLAAGNRIAERGMTVGDYAGTVRHFAVRSADDPDWPRAQPPHELSARCTGGYDGSGLFGHDGDTCPIHEAFGVYDDGVTVFEVPL